MDDSTIPILGLQEVKVGFFGQVSLIGTPRPQKLGNPKKLQAWFYRSNFSTGEAIPAVFAPIENARKAGECNAKGNKMKRPLEAAAELFRSNESLAGGDREKANLYRGLSLLAEGLVRLEKEMAEVESDMQDGPSHFYQRRVARPLRKRAIPVRARQG